MYRWDPDNLILWSFFFWQMWSYYSIYFFFVLMLLLAFFKLWNELVFFFCDCTYTQMWSSSFFLEKPIHLYDTRVLRPLSFRKRLAISLGNMDDIHHETNLFLGFSKQETINTFFWERNDTKCQLRCNDKVLKERIHKMWEIHVQDQLNKKE